MRLISLTMSILIHASLAGLTSNSGWMGKLLPVVPIQKKSGLALEFVEVPEETAEDKIKKESKVISDKTVKAKDMIKEVVKEQKTRTKVVSKGKQIAKKSQRPLLANNQPALVPPLPLQSSNLGEKQPVTPEVPSPEPPKKIEYDIINIPSVSESIFSAPLEGPISFETQAHKIGPYFKQVKKKIENYWLRYLIFKYQNTAPQESEAVVSFKILSSGQVENVSLLEHSGDELFKDFCIASIVNTAPFPPLPLNLKDEIKKEGGLSIVFTFRYR